MLEKLWYSSIVLFLAGVAVFVPAPARTEERGTRSSGVAVTFDSVDGVELHGTFHPGPKGKKSPCALLLHDVNSHSGKADWERLAEQLHDDGLAVLRFDFRGHGQSVDIDDSFWEVPANQLLLRGRTGQPPETILAADFPSRYHAMLANDIAAARLFLDRRNDGRECSTSTLLVIGAGEGATLGALWIASEYHRHQASDWPVVRLESASEGKDIACAIWLGLSPTLQERTVPVLDWVRAAGKDNGMPTAFLVGERDKSASAYADRCVTAIRGRDRGAGLTASRGVAHASRRAEGLLAAELETVTLIRNYVRNVLQKRGADDWIRRDVNEQTFYWAFRNAPLTLAKAPRERNLRLLPLAALGVR